MIKTENSIISINKDYALDKVKETLEYFCRELQKDNNKIAELEAKLIICEKRRADLARAYVKKLGVLMTKYQYNKKLNQEAAKGVINDK
jgi:hypothetical protein